MEMNINENPTLSLNIVNAEDGIGMNIQTGGGGTKDHSKLQNLDYEHAGHTGFQPAGNYALREEIPTKLSDLTNDSDFAEKSDVEVSFEGQTYETNQSWANYLVETVSGAFEDVWGELNQKYKKPSSGIPKTDLESSVQASLNKADTAVQDVSDKQNITDNTLTTTNKTIPTAINEVNSIAKGANQALSYANYSAMVTAVNALSSTALNVGQNIMIVTVEVPDLWVSGVESTSSTYTYVDDTTIVNALETNGYIQVGYYKISMLETQKVDLTNYITNTDYADTSGTPGIVKIGASWGTTISNTGYIGARNMTAAQYGDVGSGAVIGKGTLEAILPEKTLVIKGNIEANTNLNNLDNGVYVLDNIVHSSIPITKCFGVFIQYPGTYKPQVVIAGYAGECKLLYRRWLTSSSSWTTWEDAATPVDSALSSSSTNPVQNQALYNAIVPTMVYKIAYANDWSTPSSTNNYNSIAILTLPEGTFTDNSLIELVFDNDFQMWSTHGFCLYSTEVSTQRVWITSIGKPTSNINFKFRIWKYD